MKLKETQPNHLRTQRAPKKSPGSARVTPQPQGDAKQRGTPNKNVRLK